MKKWPQEHKNLFIVTILFIMLCVAVYFLLIRPLRLKISSDIKYITDTRAKLKKSKWPLDSKRLQKLLEFKLRQLGNEKTGKSIYKAKGVRNKSTLLLKESTNVFNKRIKKIFVNPADFAKEITRLDYQDEYNTVRDKLAKEHIYFSEDSLNIGSDSDAKQIYTKVLKIWLLDEIVNLAIKNSLYIVNDPHIRVKNENGQSKKTAKIELMPVIPYYLYEKDMKTYIMEFPVRLSLRGTLTQFSGFLRDIQSSGKFFPVTKLQLTAVPKWVNGEKSIFLKNSALDIDVECSAFFRQTEDIPSAMKKKKLKLLPQGA